MQNVVVYGKQTDGPGVPLTVRIAWLPDGSIKPLLYWTPERACYKIERLYECVPLAFLHNGGEGLRFNVKAVVIETPEPFTNPEYEKSQTYLYLTNNRFCEKNIVDDRYVYEGKEYIPVVMDVFPDGEYELIYFWTCGKRFKVEKTALIEPCGAFQAGGVGLRHSVDARQIHEEDEEDIDPANSVRRPAALFLELNKWFVATSPSRA